MNSGLVPTQRKRWLGNGDGSRRTISLVVSSAACLVGLGLPAYYDWSGADQSRYSPWIPGALVFMLAMVALISFVLGLRHFYWKVPSAAKIQYSRSPVVWCGMGLGVVCGFRAVGWQTLGLISSFVPLMIVMVWGLYQAFHHSRLRWPWLAMLVGCYGPFSWLFIGKYSQYATAQVFLFLAGAPMLLPAGYTSMLLQWNLHEWTWMGNAFMTVGLTLGLVLLQAGEKRALVYTLLLSTIGAASSMGLHSLIRA